MPADPRILEVTTSWWQKALDDLVVARRTTDLPFACCFHCQQAVEKAAKALLVLHQVEFRKLHDIGELLQLLRTTPAVPTAEATEGLESLTRFAVEARYPPGEASQEEAQEALGMAEKFLRWAQRQLPPELGAKAN